MADEKDDDRGDDFTPTGDDGAKSQDQEDLKTKLDDDVDEGEDKSKEDDKSESEEEKAARELAEAEKTAEEEKQKKLSIPKERYDAAVKKAREETKKANERADELEAKLKARDGEAKTEEIEKQIDDLEEKLEKAIADGNAELKASYRKQIRGLQQDISDARAAAHAARATAVAVETMRYNALVNQLETEHPETNPEHESYDQEVVDELHEYKSAFEAKGYSSSDALTKAMKAVFKGGPAPEPKKADKDADAEAKAQKAKDEAAKRAEEARKKGHDTKSKQPADTKAVGEDSDKGGKRGGKLDIEKMTDKDFDKLTDEELKALRGDDV